MSWPRESIHLVYCAKLQLFFGVLSEKLLRTYGFFKEFFVSCLLGALSVILMSDTAKKKSTMVSDDQKHTLVPEVVSMMSKITEHKLNGLNYLDWSKTIRLYVRNIRMAAHLTKDPPTDASKEQWMEEDARLYLQIRNSINSEVIGSITHYEFVKELMDYLEFLYFRKRNISRIFEVQGFHRFEKQDMSLTAHFMEFKKTYEELNMLLPFSSDIKVQQTQREQMAVMSFLASLPSEFDTAKSLILSSFEISLLQETFSRLLRT